MVKIPKDHLFMEQAEQAGVEMPLIQLAQRLLDQMNLDARYSDHRLLGIVGPCHEAKLIAFCKNKPRVAESVIRYMIDYRALPPKG